MIKLSIVSPVRNEERFLRECISSLMNQSYPRHLYELIVVDGRSTDQSREIVQQLQKTYETLRLLDNPAGVTPVARNIGIRQARGQFIMIADAHAFYPPDYLEKCMCHLEQSEASNVGGVWKIVPREQTLLGRAIVTALSHPFGVGNAHYRFQAAQPRWVDTVPGGCFRKEVFDRIGLFNERLVASQDMEFNLRLKKAGGRILLVPDIVSYYYARSDFKSFSKHNWRNGVWAVLPFLHSEVVPVRARHLIPLAFVSTLTGSAVLGLLWPPAYWGSAGIAGAYLVTNVAASIHAAARERNVALAFLLPVVFASLHISYGLGSMWGTARVLSHALSRIGRRVRFASAG